MNSNQNNDASVDKCVSIVNIEVQRHFVDVQRAVDTIRPQDASKGMQKCRQHLFLQLMIAALGFGLTCISFSQATTSTSVVQQTATPHHCNAQYKLDRQWCVTKSHNNMLHCFDVADGNFVTCIAVNIPRTCKVNLGAGLGLCESNHHTAMQSCLSDALIRFEKCRPER
ncbi:MAG: hypothetical protein H0U75_08025 [Legionella sp.]|nr:hypothetical protein [Legionella sp.]